MGESLNEVEVIIKENHLDTFGHVNNAAYLQIFEQARWDMISARGYGLAEVIKYQVGPTILEINLKFRREIKNRERIKIRTSVVNDTGKITTLRQVMINEKGEEACIADFVIGLFDLNQRKLIPPTPEWKAALGLP
ncbi:MAG TPA: acyl-CoA thioesterase [Bdellovibrionales bacterium]|nr:acyl-CoA thioesterase [Bdellovibrionales bacterium]